MNASHASTKPLPGDGFITVRIPGNGDVTGDPSQLTIVRELSATEPDENCTAAMVIAKLRKLDRLNLRRLFHALAAPDIASLSGEFDADLLSQGGMVSRYLTSKVFGVHGRWLGKAFHPAGDGRSGVGYNYFQHRSGIRRKLPMTTTLETSTLDDGLCMRICYRGKNRGPVRWLTGEVRQVTPTVLLGVGTFGPTIRRCDIYRRKIPFALSGPQGDYRGVT